MLREPTPLPIRLWSLLRQLAVWPQEVRVPFTPLARAPTRRVGRDVHQMDDVLRRGASFQPSFHIGSHKYCGRPRECNSTPDVIEKDLGEASITQSPKAFRETRGSIRWLVRTVRPWKSGRTVRVRQELGIPEALRRPRRLQHEIVGREGDSLVRRLI